MEVAGTFECPPETWELWTTVTPPSGAPHGVHPVLLDTQAGSFTADAVLASGPGDYVICATRADEHAQQTFIAVIKQDPPVGLPGLPPTAIPQHCVKVTLR